MIFLRDLAIVSVTGLAVFFDLKERRIPNWLVLVGLIWGIALHAFAGFAQLSHSLLGFLVGMAIFIIPFAFGWMGAGDVKFFGVIGALLGIEWLPRILFYSAMAAGAMALVVLLFSRFKLLFFRTMWADCKLAILTLGRVMPGSIREGNSDGAYSVPWGAAMGIGTVIAYYLDPSGNWAGF